MKFLASLALSAALATTAFAQTISIQAPVDGTTVQSGSSITVEVLQHSYSSDLVQVALAIGLSIPNLAPAIGDNILYNGPFDPQVGTLQKFIVTIPADTPAVLSICPGLPCLHRHTAHSTARFATPLLYTILRLPPPILPLLRPYSVVAKSEIPPTFGFRPCFRPILRVPPHLPTPAPLQRRARPPCYVPATSLLCPPAATLPHAPDSVPQCNPPRDASVWYCLPAVSAVLPFLITYPSLIPNPSLHPSNSSLSPMLQVPAGSNATATLMTANTSAGCPSPAPPSP
ncbi:hypothetical protein B0H13DRAFT_2341628 [Mycena leptocephala]|nr:hypothetical protein B0H13DRAFT_2341628 [Mycena leptocephala]